MPENQTNDEILYRFAAIVQNADQATLLSYIEDNFADLMKQDGKVIDSIAKLVIEAQPTGPKSQLQIASLAVNIVPPLLERWKVPGTMVDLVIKAWRVFPDPSNAEAVIKSADLCLARLDRETLYNTGEGALVRDWFNLPLMASMYTVRSIRKAAERVRYKAPTTPVSPSPSRADGSAAETLIGSIKRRLNRRKPEA